MVECPDCNKKMTKKTLKYSHAKNCLANKQQEEETKEEETKEAQTQPELLGHDDEQPPSPPPILKRTVSVKTEKKPQVRAGTASPTNTSTGAGVVPVKKNY